jgi:hypothetical protein
VNAAGSSTGADDGRIPFRVSIGVTGHRTPLDDAVVESVRRVLVHIRDHPVGPRRPMGRTARRGARLRRATPVVFTLLSSLAEGADRMIAREALELLSEHDIALRAILPLEVGDYTRDFGSDSSRREFDDLLGLSDGRVVTMPPADSREQAYARAGRYVVDHCDALIAVWDGEPGRGVGGTEEVVTYAKRRQVPTFVVSDRAPDARFARTRHPRGDAGSWAASARALRRIDEFNRLRLDGEPMLRQVQRERERLDEWDETASPIRSARRQVVDWTLPHWIRADALACRYQRRHRALGVLLFLFAALAVTSAVAAELFDSEGPFSLIEVALMLMLLGGLIAGRRADWHDRWIGYRSLAEAFRSSPFIMLAGLHDGGERQIDRRDEQWFQQAFSEAWARRPRITIDESCASAVQRFLIKAWIGEQRRYHARAAERSGRWRRSLTGLVGLSFGATLLAALLELLNGKSKPLTFLTITLPAFGAALTGIRDQRQYAQNERRSERTVARLEGLRGATTAAASLAAVQNLAAEAQAVIDDENNEWWSVAEFQDLELVT